MAIPGILDGKGRVQLPTVPSSRLVRNGRFEEILARTASAGPHRTIHSGTSDKGIPVARLCCYCFNWTILKQ